MGRDDLASVVPDQIDFDDDRERSETCTCCEDNPRTMTPASLRFLPAQSDPVYHYRMLFVCLSEQITNEEAQKLAFIVCPELDDENITPFGLIRYLSRNRDFSSANFFDTLSCSLIVIGRTDLARFLDSKRAPTPLSPSGQP